MSPLNSIYRMRALYRERPMYNDGFQGRLPEKP
jgi:hypothetical protein